MVTSILIPIVRRDENWKSEDSRRVNASNMCITRSSAGALRYAFDYILADSSGSDSAEICSLMSGKVVQRKLFQDRIQYISQLPQPRASVAGIPSVSTSHTSAAAKSFQSGQNKKRI